MKYVEKVGQVEKIYEADTPDQIADLIDKLNPKQSNGNALNGVSEIYDNTKVE